TPDQRPGANKFVLRYHFAGAGQFAASTEGTQFKKSWAMRETEQFLDALVRRLAQASQDRLAKVLPGLETNSSVLFRPLFDDLLQAESFAELRATDKGDRELDLAIQLSDDRAQVW